LSQHASQGAWPGTKNNGPGHASQAELSRGGTPQQDSLGSPPAPEHPAARASQGQQEKPAARGPAADPSGRLILWHRQSNHVRVIDPPAGGACAVCFAPDSHRLVVGCSLGGKLVIYDARSGTQDGRELDGAAGVETAIAFSPDGKRVAAGAGNQAIIWDVEGRQQLVVIQAGQAFVRRLAFHPGGRILATAGNTPAVSLWDTATGRLLGRYDWKIGKVQALAFAPDGMTAAAGGSGGQVAVWDAEDVT
jgi:WD40 repeat protein